MAGDWIKLTHAVLDKPEIRKTARMLGVKHGEALELYLRWWVWLDVNSVDGLVDQYVDQDVDELLHCDGFAACMREVGWLTTDASSGKLRVSGFDNHNGESSKKRALKSRSQANWRAAVDASVDQGVDAARSTNLSTREEKRREEKRNQSQKPLHTRAASAAPAVSKINGHGPKATRIGEDWRLPDEWKQWAIEAHHLDPQAVVRESLVFRDYWIAIPGAKGLKLNWQSTWRNWVRRKVGNA